jgi:fumarate reductase flavoprotein subunit
LEQGLMLRCDTLEELTGELEMPVEALLRSVREYDDAVDGGRDRFGRTHLVHKYGALRKIELPPFYAYPSTTVVFGTYWGVAITPLAEAVDVFGRQIKGLYAAGEMIGGFHGRAYMSGSALGKAAVFGLIAARAVAALA